MNILASARLEAATHLENKAKELFGGGYFRSAIGLSKTHVFRFNKDNKRDIERQYERAINDYLKRLSKQGFEVIRKSGQRLDMKISLTDGQFEVLLISKPSLERYQLDIDLMLA